MPRQDGGRQEADRLKALAHGVNETPHRRHAKRLQGHKVDAEAGRDHESEDSACMIVASMMRGARHHASTSIRIQPRRHRMTASKVAPIQPDSAIAAAIPTWP